MAYIGKRPGDTFPSDNAITTTLVADNAITAVKIAENAITAREIAANTIVVGNIADNAVDATKIASNSILTRHIDDNQITADQIANDAVGIAQLADLARGKIIIGDSNGDPSLLAPGSDGQILKSDGTDIAWGTDATSSDYRLKRNIRPMEDGIERIKQLKPVKFRWKGDIEESEGFLAHEIQEAGWDVGVNGQKDGKEMQTVDYGRITPLLVKALQEQQETIEALEARLKTLEE